MSGIPCPPTVGNYHENVVECVRKALKIDKLFLPHRLDSDTSGLLVLGKTLSFAQRFLKYSQSDRIVKRYRALIYTRESTSSLSAPFSCLPPFPSTLTHYMENSRSQPKYLHRSPIPDSKSCVSVLVSASPPISLSTSLWMRHSQQTQQKAGPTQRYNEAINSWLNHPYDKGLFDIYASTSYSLPVKSPPAMRSTEWTHEVRAATVTLMYLVLPLIIYIWDQEEVISFCEVELELKTGRTHQLRAQV